MGTMWDMDDPQRTPAHKPLPVPKIGGGYIADDGTGVRGDLGPFPMTRLGDGVWVTDENDPRLADFATFDHKPYMFRVTKDNGRVVYRTRSVLTLPGWQRQVRPLRKALLRQGDGA